MEYDLGLQALALLTGLSLVFGVIAHLVLGRDTRWMWLIGTIGFFVGCLIASEVVFSWATVAELQPQIDGLSFDEALLGGLVVGVPVVLLAWWANRRRHIHGPTAV
ncbi:MAG TPA: hypothetical protein VIH19_03440 [Candidatus Limnocylindria bacterium]